MCHNILLENRLNQKNSSTIFESLILNNQWDILLRMFKLNILDINITDCKGRNALYYAILNNRLEVISTLVQLNINKFVSPNFLAINFAVYLDNTKALLVLKKCGFDLNMVDAAYKQKTGLGLNHNFIDTLRISRLLNTDSENHKLETLCKYFGVVRLLGHRGLEDCEQTAQVYLKMRDKFLELSR